MIQLIKLKNNLDIITEIRSKNEKSIVLHRPFVVQSMSIPSPMGVRVVQVIRPWIENTNENNVTLPSDAILLSVSPDIELVRKYQFALEKEDVAQDIAAEIQNDPEQLQGADSDSGAKSIARAVGQCDDRNIGSYMCLVPWEESVAR